MDAITVFSLCLLLVPVVAVLGWLVYEHHEGFIFQIQRAQPRGFDVLPPRAGYSFTEVMFAVVVLGIGFVMLAAMFPVAIQQTTSTGEETTAAGIARGATNYMASIADRHSMRPTDGGVVMLHPPMVRFDGIYTQPVSPLTPTTPPLPITPANHGAWEAVKGNLILPTDARYAFVPFYSRKTGSNSAQVTMVITKCRARSQYDSTDVSFNANANLQPRELKVTITNNGGGVGVDWIKIADGPVAGSKDAVAEGAYIIIGVDPGKAPSPAGTFNGRAYRIGGPATDNAGALVADTWTLAPGNDFVPLPGVNNTFDDGLVDDWLMGNDAVAYVVGRETEVSGTGGAYRGIAQDVSVYTTFVQVKP